MITQKMKYALKALLVLADEASKGQPEPLTIEEIARRAATPKRFLEHILLEVRNAGVIASLRGRSGGYVLIKSPTEVSISELLRRMNERLWLGHFDYWTDEGVAVFRHTIPMLDRISPDPGEIAAVLAAALDAADQFLPAFNFVVWAGKSAEEAVTAVAFETHGEA